MLTEGADKPGVFPVPPLRGDGMVTARIRFTEIPQGRDVRSDMAEFAAWLEDECGPVEAVVDLPQPADRLDRALGADRTPVLHVSPVSCGPEGEAH
jgi:hypothetical protein